MKQGRKSRTGLALGFSLAALLALVVLLPAAASAQDAPSGPAPEEYSVEGLPSAGDGPGTGDVGPAAGASGDDGGGGGGDGPVLLIGLVVVAAVCTGLAVWRLRSGTGDDSPPDVGPSATGERQSI